MENNTQLEQWVIIPLLGDKYSISPKGIVRNNNTLKMLKPSLDGKTTCGGYLRVVLGNNGIRKNYSIHRLVGKAFLIEKDECINHKDGNKQNNCVENLEWTTFSENIKHSHTLPRKKVTEQPKHRIPIYAVSEKGEVIQFQSATEAARKLNLQRQSIVGVLKGRAKTLYGYKFYYG